MNARFAALLKERRVHLLEYVSMFGVIMKRIQASSEINNRQP